MTYSLIALYPLYVSAGLKGDNIQKRPHFLAGASSFGVSIETLVQPILCTRTEAIADLRSWFTAHTVTSIFAYNACFDRNHLPELRDFDWYDIMHLAAYRQYNPKIPANADCCSTGRLKRGYGVESMLRLLSGKHTYNETHNAFHDTLDELEIMKLLAHHLSDYPPL